MLLLVSCAALADDQGQVAGTQCWIGGELVGGFPPGYSCPVGGADYDVAVQGPPVIIWRHPGAEGSRMPGLTEVDTGLATQLNAIADTSWTLMYKGEFAMKNGNLAKAKLYFDEASRRDPDNPEILKDMEILKGLFDSSGQAVSVPRFQLQSAVLAPMASARVNKFSKIPTSGRSGKPNLRHIANWFMQTLRLTRRPRAPRRGRNSTRRPPLSRKRTPGCRTGSRNSAASRSTLHAADTGKDLSRDRVCVG